MKIVVRHEGASDQEVEQTCVWIVGDDGETTLGTEYLKPGEQVDVTVGGVASIDAEFGTVGPIGTLDVDEPEGDEPPAPEGNTGANAGGGSGVEPTPGAPGVASGGEAGGSVAE